MSKKLSLDLATRINVALTRTDEPQKPSFKEKLPNGAVKVGEIPFHLRHLANLLCDLEAEDAAAEVQRVKADKEFKFFLEADSDNYSIQAAQSELHHATQAQIKAEQAADLVHNLLFISAAHYIPIGISFNNLFIDTDWLIYGITQ